MATITVPDPLKNNTGTILADETGIVVCVIQASDLQSVFEGGGFTTNSSALLSSIGDAAIVAETDYHVVIKTSGGGVGVTGVITAA